MLVLYSQLPQEQYMRIQLDLSEETIDHLKKLMQTIGVETYKDLINNSVTLLDWAVEEVQAGNQIASVNEQKGKYRELTMPSLKHASRTARRTDSVLTDDKEKIPVMA